MPCGSSTPSALVPMNCGKAPLTHIWPSISTTKTYRSRGKNPPSGFMKLANARLWPSCSTWFAAFDISASASSGGAFEQSSSSATAQALHAVRTKTASQYLALYRVAAIDGYRGAGEEIRGGARQEHRDAGEICGVAPAPGRDAPEHALVQAL